MNFAHETFAASAPRKGQVVTFGGASAGVVSRVEGGLCWLDNNPDSVFIWCFRNGLNNLHDWPSK